VFTERCRKIIPALCVGMIFCFAPRSGTAAPAEAAFALATDLYAEGDWRAARREALRALDEQRESEGAQMLAADCALRINPRDESSLAEMERLSRSATNSALRARAAYRVGQTHWVLGNRTASFDAYARAFQQSADPDLFLRSGCALFLLRREDRTLGEEDPGLLQQLATCRDLWRFELRDEVRVAPLDAKKGASLRPAVWFVSFYRSQIAPAIAQRCSLEPSCSAYFLEANRDHRWLGLPLIGDRLVREPSVVQAAENPVERKGRTRFLDPVKNHTYWLKHEK